MFYIDFVIFFSLNMVLVNVYCVLFNSVCLELFLKMFLVFFKIVFGVCGYLNIFSSNKIFFEGDLIFLRNRFDISVMLRGFFKFNSVLL